MLIERNTLSTQLRKEEKMSAKWRSLIRVIDARYVATENVMKHWNFTTRLAKKILEYLAKDTPEAGKKLNTN